MAQSMRHFYVNCEREAWRFETLSDLLSYLPVTLTLVFCNSGAKAEWLAHRLVAEGFSVAHLHLGHTASEIENAVRGFQMGHYRVLVLADSVLLQNRLGEGLWYLALVLSYDIPQDYARRLEACSAPRLRLTMITLVTNSQAEAEESGNLETELVRLRHVERSLGISIDECPDNIDRML